MSKTFDVINDKTFATSKSERQGIIKTVSNYISVLKPRETALLTFIGICSAFVAGSGHLPLNTFLLALVAILVASAGANGLTNYLDRDVDARMPRTRHRVLPSRRIYPPQKVLPLTISLTVIGLVLAWFLHPLAFAFDLLGTLAAVIYRKKVTCVFPQGAIASAAPVLMGWFAVAPPFRWEIVLLCLLIALWLPSHIWSIMIANRQEYLNAGLTYYPASREAKDTVWVILGFNILMYAASIALYFVGGFHLLYLVIANMGGIAMLYGNVRFILSGTSRDGWRLYKLSAFPYLGVLFLSMVLDIWVL
jgi:protoheme IX farnesyltransferase